MASNAESAAPEPTGAREALVPLLVIAAATAVVYSNTLDASFQWDDFPHIVEDEAVRDLGRWWPPTGRRWLGQLTFALNYRFGGLDVRGYHLVNTAVHVCTSLLVAWLAALTLSTPRAREAEAGPLLRSGLPLAAGLLFAVHPTATQAVTYVVQRFTSLATLFYLLALALHVQGRLAREERSTSRARTFCLHFLSVLAAAAAMKTKEISFTLPLVAAGYELLFFKRMRLPLVPLALTALLVPLGLSSQDLSDVAGDASRFGLEGSAVPRWTYLLTQSRVVVRYLRLVVVPSGQNLDYDFSLSRSVLEPEVLLALATVLSVIGLAAYLLARALERRRVEGLLVFFGVAWFFVTLSVESSVIPIADVIFEHRMYLPNAGAAVALGTALLWSGERVHWPPSLAARLAAALLVTAGPLGIATYSRNFVWKDEVTLWEDVVSKSPRKKRPHVALGVAYEAEGRLDEAMRHYLTAVEIDPRSAVARNNLGGIYREKGLLEAALLEYREALRIAPGYAAAHNNLGVAYADMGRLEEAIAEYQQALRLKPRYARARSNLGAAFGAQGRFDDAIREFREALRLDPGLVEARENLRVALVRTRSPREGGE